MPSLVERLASALSLGSPEVMPPVPDGADARSTEERIVAVTRRVIEEAVQTGPAVFVGRGAQCLLAERSDALHVFCYRAARRAAPSTRWRSSASTRLRRSASVAEMNKQREQYVKRHWNRNWLAHENYHLCVNTSWLGTGGRGATDRRIGETSVRAWSCWTRRRGGRNDTKDLNANWANGRMDANLRAENSVACECLVTPGRPSFLCD